MIKKKRTKKEIEELNKELNDPFQAKISGFYFNLILDTTAKLVYDLYQKYLNLNGLAEIPSMITAENGIHKSKIGILDDEYAERTG